MIVDCWNSIGVRGDLSCPELVQHVHCHNCPVHASAAAAVLRQSAVHDAILERTSHFAAPKSLEDTHDGSVLIFRIGVEWLALPTTVVKEVIEPRPVHSLPHRRGTPLLGVTNVRGELLTALSLGLLLGLQAAPDSNGKAVGQAYQRMLVLSRDSVRIASLADEVHGVHRFRSTSLRGIPASLAAASARYSKSLLPWKKASVGMLDEQLLFYTVKRCLA